jgi:hypothetical protein
MFPIIEGLHLLGIGASAGAIAISDLRMAGKIFRKEPISDVFNGVLPWMIVGFIVMTITGLLLMWAEPTRCYESIWFRFKVLFLILGSRPFFEPFPASVPRFLYMPNQADAPICGLRYISSGLLTRLLANAQLIQGPAGSQAGINARLCYRPWNWVVAGV